MHLFSCQNTTQGTVSNNDGYFFLRLPAGGYDMVISYTGYDKKVIRIGNNHPSGDTLSIELMKQEKTMEEVAVVATNEVKDGWEKYGAFFIENFIGTSVNAGNCKIQNPEILKFYFNKRLNRLKVKAAEDLIVQNYALGYSIRYQLDSFTYEYNNNISQFTGAPLFIEMDSTEEIKSQWLKNRARTYLGSRLHFMRSYYDSTLAEDGFLIEKMNADPRSTKGTFINDVYDSLFYGVDSTNAVIVEWQGRYRISYKSVLPDKKFLTEFKLPDNTRMQVTVIDILNGFVIEQNGYFYNQNEMTNNGYWAWKKLAEFLPYDYEFE